MLIRYTSPLALLALLFLAMPAALQAQSLYVPAGQSAFGVTGSYLSPLDSDQGPGTPVLGFGASIKGRVDIGFGYSWTGRQETNYGEASVRTVAPYANVLLVKQNSSHAASAQISVGYGHTTLVGSDIDREERRHQTMTLGVGLARDLRLEPHKHTILHVGFSNTVLLTTPGAYTRSSQALFSAGVSIGLLEGPDASLLLEPSLQTDFGNRVMLAIGASVVFR